MNKLIEAAFDAVIPFNKLDRDPTSPFNDDPLLVASTSPSNFPPHETLLTRATGPSHKNASRVVLDARVVSTPKDLDDALHFIGNFTTNNLKRNGSLLIVTSHDDPLTSSIAEGFIRALSKEAGAKGITTNLVEVNGDPTTLLTNIPAVTFFTSTDSSFVTGQRLVCDVSPPPSSPPPHTSSIVITGGARGIGLETAALLSTLPDTTKMLLVDHPMMSAALEKSADSIKSLTNNRVDVSSLSVDVCDDDAGAKIMSSIASPIDSIVHAAGVTRDKTMKRMKKGIFDECMDINYHSVLAIDDQIIANDGYSDGARITLLSSTSGVAGNFGQVNYASSKSGLLGYAAWRTANNPSLVVNAVAPGFIATPMTANLPLFNRVIVPRFLTNVKCMGKPSDVAHAIKFLSSRGGGSKGTFLRVCGGLLLGR